MKFKSFGKVKEKIGVFSDKRVSSLQARIDSVAADDTKERSEKDQEINALKEEMAATLLTKQREWWEKDLNLLKNVLLQIKGNIKL